MADSATFCCVQCRLLQPPAGACAECGAPMTAPVELVRELLYYRDMKMVSGRDWSLITALFAGSSIALPVLAPVALASLTVLGVQKLREWRRRAAIAGIALPPPYAAPGATTLFGHARKLRSTVTSLVDGAPVLLEHAIVRDRTGVLLRRAEAAPFLLEVEGEAPVLVTGATRVVSPSLLVHFQRVRRGDPRLRRMGVPEDLAIAGDLEIATLDERGPALAITGVVEEDAVAELAFHRDGGRVRVVHGRPGAPVVVADRRLAAIAPA